MKIILTGTPPSTQHIYRHKGFRVYMTREGMDKKEQYQWEIKAQYKKSLITKKFGLIMEFYFPDDRKRDLDNFNKLILDSGAGIAWEDDDLISEMHLYKFVDKKNPRVELEIIT